jgi:ribonuclease E
MKKEMLINVLQPEECRIAIIEDGFLEELYVERTSHESYTGNIYKGRIVNLEPAIQAAFVDFSVGRNGFLHVSDVEPSYYRKLLSDDVELGGRDRNRDARRDRDQPRSRPRAEDREAREALPPPALGEQPPRRSRPDRERDRPERERAERERPDREQPERDRPERERPDRAEKGRRERHERRRFGEGLTDDEEERLAAPPAAEETVPANEPEPNIERPLTEPAEMFRSEPQGLWLEPPAEERAEREAPEDPITEERIERAFGMGIVETDELIGWGGREAAPPSPPPPPSGRGRRSDRGRSTPPPPASPAQPEAPSGPEEALPPVPEEEEGAPPSEETRRPRGGRAAIRSRSGATESDRPRESRHAPRAFPQERPSEGEFDRPRGRSRDAGRASESDAREPSRPHARAGEPGYVPRRERTRYDETAFPTAPESEVEPASDLAPPSPSPDLEGIEIAGEPGRSKGPKRRRRRRGRRRERPEREGTLEPAASGRDELRRVREEDDLESLTGDVEDDELGFDELGDQVDIDDDDDLPGSEVGSQVTVEDRIDPELEEEIRKEVEEITELEREMGLRGPIEARPRRGEPAEPMRGPRAARGRGPAKPPIQEIFKRGDEVLVQVIKESIGTKGPTLSTYISIPGRYLVLMPGLNRVGVSRKIADESQRRKLREIMNELNPPKGLGFIVRTAGLERSKRELARDLAYLLRLWKVILRRIKKTKAPAPIYQESDMIIRTIRDIFTSEIDTIWIDEPAAFERAQEFLRVVMPRYVSRLKFWDEKVPLFHKYGIEEEIAKIQRRQIPLPEGGSLVIDQTEALVAIDVNSGNFRVENDAERTAYEMNIRAAKEIARQLRLRDLGGVIVNDFIDMREERNRRGVERALREAVKRDRARTKVLRMSAFGLIEMTRQRIRPSLRRSVYEDCAHCNGTGVAKTAESMAIDVMRLLALAAHREDIRRVNVTVCAAVSTYLNNRKRREVARLESEANMMIHIRHDDDVPAEHLQIDCFDAQNNEIRLLPAPPPAARRAR